MNYMQNVLTPEERERLDPPRPTEGLVDQLKCAPRSIQPKMVGDLV